MPDTDRAMTGASWEGGGKTLNSDLLSVNYTISLKEIAITIVRLANSEIEIKMKVECAARTHTHRQIGERRLREINAPISSRPSNCLSFIIK